MSTKTHRIRGFSMLRLSSLVLVTIAMFALVAVACTSEDPTATPIPPTATSVPPTATPIPPTEAPEVEDVAPTGEPIKIGTLIDATGRPRSFRTADSTRYRSCRTLDQRSRWYRWTHDRDGAPRQRNQPSDRNRRRQRAGECRRCRSHRWLIVVRGSRWPSQNQ